MKLSFIPTTAAAAELEGILRISLVIAFVIHIFSVQMAREIEREGKCTCVAPIPEILSLTTPAAFLILDF